MKQPIIEEIKKRFQKIVLANNLLEKEIIITSKVLTPEEAIGNPDRSDFPILTGKERIMEASFENTKSNVFTDMPGNWTDTLKNILKKEIKNNFHRAILISSINCVMRYLGLIQGTVHCKDNQPEECAIELFNWLKENYKSTSKIALIGFQPAFVEKLSKEYILKVLDLNKQNFGIKYGVEIYDGSKDSKKIINWSDVVIATGTIFVNGSIDNIAEIIPLKNIIYFGVSCAGISKLLDLERICFYPT
jgi:hypothetical protein